MKPGTKEKILKHSNIYAFLGYVLLTIFLTYPVIRYFHTHFAGYGDVYLNAGIIWWLKEALVELRISPFYNQLVYYPTGAIYPTGFGAFLPVVFACLFNLVASYNLYFFLTFVLAGYGMYLLVHYLIQDRRAAFISGIIFAFCPFHLNHAQGHLHMMSIQWMPFFVLYLFKMSREEKKKIWYGCLGALFFVLTALSSWALAIFLLLFTFLFLLYKFLKCKEAVINKDFLVSLALMALLSCILLLPIVIPLSGFLFQSYMYKPIEEINWFSADLVSFFVPDAFHPILGKILPQSYKEGAVWNSVEKTVYIGYAVLFLSIFAFRKLRRDYNVKFFALSALIFFILSLGLNLHIYNRWQFIAHRFGIPLPYFLLYKLPVIKMIRCPCRISIMLVLSLSILSGYGMREVCKRIKRLSKKNLFVIFISGLIIFEYLFVPYRISKADIIPDFYYQLAKDKDDYAILELPIVQDMRYEYATIVHNKKVIGGFGSRSRIPFREFILKTPVLREFWQLEFEKKVTFDYDIPNTARQVFGDLGIRYIIIHKDPQNRPRKNYSAEIDRNMIRRFLGDTNPCYEDEQMIVYKITKEWLKQ